MASEFNRKRAPEPAPPNAINIAEFSSTAASSSIKSSESEAKSVATSALCGTWRNEVSEIVVVNSEGDLSLALAFIAPPVPIKNSWPRNRAIHQVEADINPLSKVRSSGGNPNYAVRAEYSAAVSSPVAGAESSISAIQPAPYGSELIDSGALSKSEFMATIFPDTGA